MIPPIAYMQECVRANPERCRECDGTGTLDEYKTRVDTEHIQLVVVVCPVCNGDWLYREFIEEKRED